MITPSMGMRIVLTIAAGFAFSTSLVGLGAVALPLAAGMARSEAMLLCAMLGFLVYLGCLVWGFAARSVSSIAIVFVGGGLLAWALAIFLRSLIQP